MKILIILISLLTLPIACKPIEEQIHSTHPVKEIQPKETAPENRGK